MIDLDATYDFDSKSVQGTFEADKARLQDLVTASQRYVPASLTSSLEALSQATGDLSIGTSFEGPVEAPNLKIDTFEGQNLQYKGQAYGSLTADNVTRENGVWTIPSIILSGPEGKVSAQGTVQENGPINITSSADNLHISAFGPFEDALSTNQGVASFSLSATGDSSQPAISGSLKIDHLAKAPESAQNEDLSVVAPHIALSNKGIHVDGSYNYAGFAGSLSGDAPFHYGQGIGDQPISAHLALNQQPIADIPLIDTFVDPSRSKGTISGDLTLSGPLSELKYTGGLTVNADTMAFRFSGPNPYVKQIDDEFKNFVANIGITSNQALALNVKGDVVRGGSLTLNLETPLSDLSEALKQSAEELARKFLDSPLNGSFQLNHTKLSQSFVPGGNVAMEINGSTPIAGTLRRPEIGTSDKPGSFTISHASTSVPTLPASTGESTAYQIDPLFNIEAALTDPAAIHEGRTADLSLTGDTSLKGSLSDPRVDANLVVDHGTILLPGGTVRLDQGGTINFNYRKPLADQMFATADVDLVGHTAVTAYGLTGTTQRYNITLEITGDLLRQQGLQINAFSDPPDLSSDDVLALLGEKGLFESLSTADQSATQQRLQAALAGWALPSLTSPLMAGIARSLGVDLISLDYNAIDLATLSVARALSPEFSVQYRQQLGTPPPGFRSIFDFRLVYTPRRGPAFLRRLSLSAGADQDNPWKVSLEYGLRFGTPSTGPRTKTIISP